MNLDEILMAVGLAVVIWLLGYKALAIFTVVVLLVVSVIFRGEKKVAKNKALEGITIKGPVEVLEPIVIETKRKPPFRIPSEMNAVIQAKGYKDIDREKYSTKLFYNLAKLFLVLVRGRKKSDSK